MEEAWSLPDVYLVTEGLAGEVAVPHLTLTFLELGLSLAMPDGEPVWEPSWDGLDEISVVERSILPDGGDGVLIVVVEKGRKLRHRFVVGTGDPASTEEAIRVRAAAHGLRTAAPHRAVSRWLIALVIVAAVGAMAALLLSAAHVFQF
jgi:hypothetical protein